MTIELTAEMEKILSAESFATGLSPAEITLRVLTTYMQRQSDSPVQRKLEDAVGEVPGVSPEIIQNRLEAGKRIFALREKLAARGVVLPETADIRDWIHEGHCF